MRFLATRHGEWPPGIHWAPGEIREVPEDWPSLSGTPPEWLLDVPEDLGSPPEPAPTPGANTEAASGPAEAAGPQPGEE